LVKNAYLTSNYPITIDKKAFSNYNYDNIHRRSETMIFDKVKDIIMEELGVEEDKVLMESNLSEDLGADSLDAIELIMAVEEAFDIEIPDNEATKIRLVSDIINFLEAAGK